ncbi:MAG: hypothetical protein P1U61_01150 [Legionellaceae bacterium]|nr:hypothetical protein [Legionellaceae bacterium]
MFDLKKISLLSLAFFIYAGVVESILGQIFKVELPLRMISFASLSLYPAFVVLKTLKVPLVILFVMSYLVLMIPSLLYVSHDWSWGKSIGAETNWGGVAGFLLFWGLLSLASIFLFKNIADFWLFFKIIFFLDLCLLVVAFTDLNHFFSPGRISPYGINPIWLARFMSFNIAWAVLLFISDRIKPIFCLIISLLSLYIILKTGARGPLLALIVCVMALLVRNFFVFSAEKRLFFLSLFVIAVIFFWVINLQLRAFSHDDPTRLLLINFSIENIKTHPLGIGFGNFIKLQGVYAYPHNLVLQFILEFGWLFGGYFALTMLIFLMYSYKISKNSIILSGCFITFMLAFLNSNVSGDLFSPKEIYIFIPVFIRCMLFNEFKSHLSLEKIYGAGGLSVKI